MNIGRAILEIRKEKGLKQESVALDAGTDTGYLSRIEQGARRPSLAMLEKFAAALGVTVSSLVARAESTEICSNVERHSAEVSAAIPDESRQFRQSFQTLTSENQHLAVEFLKLLQRMQGDR